MIFKTMTNTSGKTGIQPNNFISGLFNGDLFKKQTFSLSEVLSTSDVDAIKAYNKQIDNCVTSQTAFNRTMLNTSKEAQNVVAAANGNKVALDGLTKSSKAAELGMKALAMAGNMLLIYALTSAVDIIYKCATASDRLAESASQMGSEFASTKSDISDYKTKIEELYQTINDDTSSYEDTYNARQELLKIQDEMIDKFGDEADAVKFVTDAINGQTDSLDTLTQDKWQETVNAFNSDRGKGWTEKVADVFANIGHDNNNFQRMIDEMENTKVTFHMIPMYGDDTYEEFSKKLKEDFGADITRTERDDAITLSGDLDTIYKQLLNIQTLAKGMGIDDTFLNDLGNQADEAKSKLDEYQEMYSQHVLYDKVFNSEEYEKSFDAINKAYEKYQDAFASGDEESIEKAKQNYAEIVQSATEGLDDQSVINYFNSMYPDLQEVVGGWEFEVKFKAAVDDNSDDFEKDVQDAVSKFGTVEDIKNYNPKVATDEQKDAYLQLKQYADDYGLTLDQLIDKLVQLGLLQSQSKSDLLNKLIPSKSAPTAGVTSILTDAMDSVDADEATKWVESLTEEEAKLANSKDFENALEEQKKKLNGASLSADDYAAALQAVKDKQNENSDETPISTITTSVQQIKDQLSSAFKELGDAYQNIFTKNGFSIEDVDNDMLSGIKSAFEELEGFDTSNLDKFFDTLTNSASTADQVQQAFNDLATTYFYSTDTLNNLNNATAESIEQQLEEMGVANAHEVVYDALNGKMQALALQKQFATQTGYDLINATSEEAVAFLNEAGASETARGYLLLLIAQEQVFSNQDLNVEQKIQKLQQLASEYGNTALAASVAAKMEEATKSAATGGSYSFQDAFNEAKTEFEKAATTVNIDFKSIGGGSKSAGSAGKEAGDAYLEAFEKELGDLDDLKDRGIISEKEYLDRLRELYQRYFKDKEKYVDQYQKYEKKYLDGMYSLYNSALSGITKLMGKQIDKYSEEKEVAVSALEEERDARLAVIDAQKEQLQSQIDLIEKQIDEKQKEIDAINDAADARKRELDLQKAQYELERARNQRTKLVKICQTL